MADKKIIIEPPSGINLHLRELWQYRELFYFFTWRDIKVKYKQTSLGILWAVLQPLALMLLFTLVFSKNLKFDSGTIRYEIFVLSGLILWGLFSSGVSQAAESIVQQSGIIKKIYFPRLIIPSSALLVALFDFFIAFLLFLLFCIIYKQPLSWTAVALFPLAILHALLSAFGFGTLLSALTVKFRDFRYVLPFLIQFLFFASAVVYSLHTIGQPWLKDVLAVNPINGALVLFRAAIGEAADWRVLIISTLSMLIFFFAGLIFFRKTESYFADLA